MYARVSSSTSAKSASDGCAVLLVLYTIANGVNSVPDELTEFSGVGAREGDGAGAADPVIFWGVGAVVSAGSLVPRLLGAVVAAGSLVPKLLGAIVVPGSDVVALVGAVVTAGSDVVALEGAVVTAGSGEVARVGAVVTEDQLYLKCWELS